VSGTVDPASIGYRVNAVAFNKLSEMMSGDEWFVPLSERMAIARAIVEAIEPMIRADERASQPSATNCEACWHLWSLHKEHGCSARLFPGNSLADALCPCEHTGPQS
jgi:hypothetical protein